MQVSTIGLDIAKRVFQVHDDAGAAVIRKKLRRSELLQLFARLAPCVIGIEACATAHYWARELTALGHHTATARDTVLRMYDHGRGSSASSPRDPPVTM
jgi:transposase